MAFFFAAFRPKDVILTVGMKSESRMPPKSVVRRSCGVNFRQDAATRKKSYVLFGKGKP